ncbi:MAG TPA: heme exporter protein CcmD [Gammaproteobacteria bacterium]|nr:heme exporter protein CcmD [Gammaproteobacteria bacterium]
MSSWHEFFTMGGYAAYVWPAYVIVLVVMVANAILPGRRQRALLKHLRRRMPGSGAPK